MNITREQAIALGTSGWWVGRPAREVALFQMEAQLLCMPFNAFHEAIEKALDRPVFTHEMGLNWEGLKAELEGNGPAPTFDEILALLGDRPTIVVQA